MTSAATPASSRPERRDPASGAEAGSFAGRVARRAAEVALAPFAEVGALARMLSEAVFWGARPRYRGRVIVDGEDVAKLQGEALTRMRSKFGMVFQWAALFDSMTVGRG